MDGRFEGPLSQPGDGERSAVLDTRSGPGDGDGAAVSRELPDGDKRTDSAWGVDKNNTLHLRFRSNFVSVPFVELYLFEKPRQAPFVKPLSRNYTKHFHCRAKLEFLFTKTCHAQHASCINGMQGVRDKLEANEYIRITRKLYRHLSSISP